MIHAQHQTEAKELTLTAIDEGIKRILIRSPTGSGKTVIFGDLIRHFTNNNNKVLVLTDRKDLLSQTEGSIKDFYGIEGELIEAKRKRLPKTIDVFTRKETLLCIAMVDTLSNRIKKPEWAFLFKKIDLIIIDEAHERRFSKIINNPLFEETIIIGYTATPIYSNRTEHMHQDYEKIIVLPNEKELIEDGYLVPCKTIACNTDIINAQKTATVKNGEYTDESQIELQKQYVSFDLMIEIYLQECNKFLNQMEENCPEVYNKYYKGERHLKAIFFGVNSKHVLSITNAFNDYGISAKYILSDTKIQPKTERDKASEDFKNNKFKVLVNCQITTKGYDSKDTLIIGKMFLTKSLAKDNQTAGRGSRPLVDRLHYIETPESRREAITESPKPYFIVIDYLANFALKERGAMRGRWQDAKDWGDIFKNPYPPKKEKGEAPEKQCPQCKNMVKANIKICDNLILDPLTKEIIECGYLFQVKEAEKDEKKGEFAEVTDSDINGGEQTDFKALIRKTPVTISNLYKEGEIKYKHALWAIRKKGEFHLITFAQINQYKSPKNWICKLLNIENNQFNVILGQYIDHQKEVLKKDLYKEYEKHPFIEIKIAKIRQEAKELLRENNRNWLDMENKIRSKYISY